MYDALVTRGGGLAAVIKHFELSPGAGWEKVEGQETLALAARLPDGATSLQPLRQFRNPPATRLDLGYGHSVGGMADILAVLSESDGHIEFTLIPLGK